MAQLERKALVHFLDSTFGGATPSWFKIGVDIEDMSVALNPDVETKENILGESRTSDKGYKPAMDADPYYANPTDGDFYTKLRDIALERKKNDACKTKILEVIMEDTEGPHLAFMEDVIVKPQSYGGGIEGVNIPYNVAFNGNRVKGTVTFTNGVPEFTAAS